jgi:hypothetical protein
VTGVAARGVGPPETPAAGKGTTRGGSPLSVEHPALTLDAPPSVIGIRLPGTHGGLEQLATRAETTRYGRM